MSDELFGVRVRVARVAWRMTANRKQRYAPAPEGDPADGVRWYPMVLDGFEYTFRVAKSQQLFGAWPGETVGLSWPGLPLDGSNEELPSGEDGLARIRRLGHPWSAEDVHRGSGGLWGDGVLVGQVRRTEGPVWGPQRQADDYFGGGAHAERTVSLFVVALAPVDLSDGPCLRYVAAEDLEYVGESAEIPCAVPGSRDTVSA